MFAAMPSAGPIVDPALQRLFNARSFDQVLRRSVRRYLRRGRMSRSGFGLAAVGDSKFMTERFGRGRTVCLSTADRILVFIGHPPRRAVPAGHPVGGGRARHRGVPGRGVARRAEHERIGERMMNGVAKRITNMRATVAVLGTLVLGGCATSHVGNTWQCPLIEGQPCQSVKDADPAAQVLANADISDSAASELFRADKARERAPEATCRGGCRPFGWLRRAFTPRDEEQKDAGVDAVGTEDGTDAQAGTASGGDELEPEASWRDGARTPEVLGRIWIAPYVDAAGDNRTRSIPASTGKPMASVGVPMVAQVYPREHGETSAKSGWPSSAWGLSPRARGNRRARTPAPGRRRST